MNYWFTADTHLGHVNIIKYCNRPFNNVDEMDNTILNNLYNSVKQNDRLYILGDLAWDYNYYIKIKKFCNNNSIKLYLLHGNHDATHEGKDLMNIDINNQSITLCHYPMISWYKSHFNSWMLYGHVHNNGVPLKGKLMNVGVDCNNFEPVNFEQIKEYMDKQPDNYNFIPLDKRRY